MNCIRNIFVLIIVCASFGVHAIELSDEIIYQHKVVSIELSEPSDSVNIQYRPNSQVVVTEWLTSESPKTSFQWVPQRAGVVAISTATETTNVSVRSQSVSISGLVVMLVAGIILFGGAYYAFRLLMNREEIPLTTEDMERRPDT